MRVRLECENKPQHTTTIGIAIKIPSYRRGGEKSLEKLNDGTAGKNKNRKQDFFSSYPKMYHAEQLSDKSFNHSIGRTHS